MYHHIITLYYCCTSMLYSGDTGIIDDEANSYLTYLILAQIA